MIADRLCDACVIQAISNRLDQGERLIICSHCDIGAATDYINNQRNFMETIKSKRALHSKIKEVLERTGDDLNSFPVSITFSEGMGEPVFSISIERSSEDHFVDEKGQKWIKA